MTLQVLHNSSHGLQFKLCRQGEPPAMPGKAICVRSELPQQLNSLRLAASDRRWPIASLLPKAVQQL